MVGRGGRRGKGRARTHDKSHGKQKRRAYCDKLAGR